MMSTRFTTDTVDSLPPMDTDDGWSHKGCNWTNAPCGDTAQYFVSYPCPEHGSAHAGETVPFCPRHYARSLLYVAEVAMPGGDLDFADLVLEHGAL